MATVALCAIHPGSETPLRSRCRLAGIASVAGTRGLPGAGPGALGPQSSVKLRESLAAGIQNQRNRSGDDSAHVVSIHQPDACESLPHAV